MAEDKEILPGLKGRFAERQAGFREAVGGIDAVGELTVEQILAWADAHHAAHGAWPEAELRSGLGPVDGVPGESWTAINRALVLGLRGLPGGSSLDELLAAHRGAAAPDRAAEGSGKQIWARQQEPIPLKRPQLRGRVKKRSPPLTVDQVLAWADAHHAASGRWPTTLAGAVAAAPGQTWASINCALASGLRGLPRGSSLARLLALHRGYRNRKALPRLTVAQILAWADAHHAAHGRWPTIGSGPVTAAPGETWCAVEQALTKGFRGLSGGMTLARLLRQHRDRRYRAAAPPLTVAQILAWADAHHAAHGRWPTAKTGAVTPAPGETWNAINTALTRGFRGLRGGTTLSRLLATQRQTRDRPHSSQRPRSR